LTDYPGLVLESLALWLQTPHLSLRIRVALAAELPKIMEQSLMESTTSGDSQRQASPHAGDEVLVPFASATQPTPATQLAANASPRGSLASQGPHCSSLA
jgi:hypothetical protein